MIMGRLTLKEKLDVIDRFDKGEKVPDLVIRFDVSPSAIRKILDNKEKYVYCAKEGVNLECQRVYPKLCKRDKIVSDFIEKANKANVPLSTGLIRSRALSVNEELTENNENSFHASNGWYYRFKKRRDLTKINLHGHARTADDNKILTWLIDNCTVLLNYKKCDVYNCDETGLVAKQLSTSTITFNSEKNNMSGIKKDKYRITIHLCCSLTGEKEVPLVIGYHAKPQCFKSISYNYDRLPVKYNFSKNAWMTQDIFSTWLQEWNVKLVGENRKILLIMDNFSGHSVPYVSNIEILFLPENTTSKLQPLDAGIIQNFKSLFKVRLHQRLAKEIETKENFSISTYLKKYDLLQIIKDVEEAWNSVSPQTIKNCWKHSKISQIYESHNVISNNEHNYSR